jgi:hypothetical protein
MFDASGGLSLTHPGKIKKYIFSFFVIFLAFLYLAFILADGYEQEYKIPLIS